MTDAVVIEALCVGRPRAYGTPGVDRGPQKYWTSAIAKTPVSGPLALSRTQLDGDGQADLIHHGGVDKAVCAYAAAHYPYWRETLGRDDFTYGAFGENLALSGLDEDGVCLGDRWALGEVLLEVSQPRQPCWKLDARWSIPRLNVMVQRSGRTGFYFRVVRTGQVAAGRAMTLEARPHPEWTIARTNEVYYRGAGDLEASAALAAVPALSRSWRERVGARVPS